MDNIYTMESLFRDKEFIADPGQEIDKCVYNHMYHASITRPLMTLDEVSEKLGFPVHGGFVAESSVKQLSDNHSDSSPRRIFARCLGDGKERFFYVGIEERRSV